MKRMLRSCTSLLLAFCLVLGLCSNGLAILAVDTGSDSKGELNYVSIGDSMANGYGFVGYEQDSDDRAVYDLMGIDPGTVGVDKGFGMYGNGAYPLQFEAWLEDQGYVVNHTKLAPSALLAEDLLYLLDGREEFDDGWGGYKAYVGTYTDAELKPYIQEAITNADLITMGIGNAAFGAFMLDRVTSAMGVFGASLDEDEKLNLADAIAVLNLDEQQHALVMEQYANMKAQMVDKVPADMLEKEKAELAVDIIAYTVASYVVNYKMLVEKILAMNPDVEIVLVGLLNTTYGMNVTDDEGNVIMAFGDTMDDLFDALNGYMAGLPTLLQSKGVAPKAKLYFAEQPEPKFICQVFQELIANGWEPIQDGRLSGETVRKRNISAFNDSLGYMIGMAVNGAPLVHIDLADVEAYEALDWEALATVAGQYWNPWMAFAFSGHVAVDFNNPATYTAATDRILAVAIYLAIEEAVAKSTTTMEIQLSGLLKIAGDLSSVFSDLGEPPTGAPEETRVWLLNGLSTEETQGMCKIYGLFKVGNGMSVHPTPEGHDEIAKSVIAAYDGKYSAADHAVWYLYEQLKADGILSDDDKAAIIGFILSEMKGSNKDIALVEDVYSFLNGKYLSNEETIDVVIYVYEIMLGVRSENEVPGKIYALLNDNTYLTDSEKVEIIEYIYTLLKANGYLDGYNVALLDDLYAYIDANEYLTDEQKVDIIVYAYGLLLDGELSEADKTAIVKYVYAELSGQMTNDEMMTLVAGIAAILDKHGVMTDDDKVAALEGIADYLVENGYVDAAKAEAIAYAKDLAAEMETILRNNLEPTAQKLEGELKTLNLELKSLTDALDIKMADLIEKQEGILADMIDQRDALIAELASLNAKLEAIKNGSYGRSATTASAKDQMIAELEADIARTEAEIAELNETIAWVVEQINSDKSGIEAIQAAIADVKANIIATEEALAELNAAIDQLVDDLAELNEALEVLANAAKALSDKTVGKVDVEAVVEAVMVVIEKIPAIIETVKTAYNQVAELIEDVQTAVEEIKASAAVIEGIVETLAASAEDLAAVAGEQAEALKQTAEEIAVLVEDFVNKNLPEVEAALVKTYEELEAVVLRELAKAEALWIENETTVYAALAIGYWYCEQKGYIAGAEKLVTEYAELLEVKLGELEIKLGEAEIILNEKLAEAEKWLNAELPVWEARLAELKAELKDAVDAETKAAIEAAIAEAEAKIAELKAMIEDAKAVIAAVKAYIAEVKAAIADVKTAAEAVADAAKVVGEDIVAIWKALKNLKSALCELTASVVNLHNAAADEAMKLLGYCGMIAGEAVDVVETLGYYVDLLGYIPAMLEEAYIDAITDHYLVSIDSHYVALGDANAYGEAANKLADKLTQFLGAEVGFDNLTVEGQSAAALLNALSDYAASIEKADLVTIGFSANTFTQFVVTQLQEALAGGTPAEMDWEAYLGEQGAAYVAEALAALKAELESSGAGEYMGMNIADILVLAVESYTYAYVEYVVNYIQVIEGVHAINPDAQVVLVGMHNPMANVVLNAEGTEIAIGDYLEYLVKVTNAYALGYAFVVPQSIYVDAPAVETVNVRGVQEALFFVMDLMMNGTASYVPTDAGYTYIQEQIWNALNVYKAGMLGDVDSDGDVDYIDAMLTLQYYTAEIGASDLDVTVADVDGNGVVNYVDAMLILQYYTQEIAVFPAA